MAKCLGVSPFFLNTVYILTGRPVSRCGFNHEVNNAPPQSTKFQHNRIMHGWVTVILPFVICAPYGVRHLGFVQKWILTIPRPMQSRNAPSYQISTKSVNGWLSIDDSSAAVTGAHRFHAGCAHLPMFAWHGTILSLWLHSNVLYLRQGRYVMPFVCLFVCLSVCLSFCLSVSNFT